MSAPTEAEIREAISYRMAALPGDDPADHILEGIEEMADFMYGPSTDKLSGEPAHRTSARKCPADVWDDLRRPEAACLDALYTEATQRALARCLEVVTEELVIAGVAFAAAFPDAPRATLPSVAA
jgi:hypothetical protein